MNSWIIYVPILVGLGGLGLGLWNARTSARKDTVATKNTETDNLIIALKGQMEIHEKEIASLKEGKTDLEKRMLACELARDDLARRNLELEREKINLLTQLVAVGIGNQLNVAQNKK